jgi:hypothetical protein
MSDDRESTPNAFAIKFLTYVEDMLPANHANYFNHFRRRFISRKLLECDASSRRFLRINCAGMIAVRGRPALRKHFV